MRPIVPMILFALLGACQSRVEFLAEGADGELTTHPTYPLTAPGDPTPLGFSTVSVTPIDAGAGEFDRLAVEVVATPHGDPPVEVSLLNIEVRDQSGRLLARDGDDPGTEILLDTLQVPPAVTVSFRTASGIRDVDWVDVNLRWLLPADELQDQVRFEKIVEAPAFVRMMAVSFGVGFSGGSDDDYDDHDHSSGGGRSRSVDRASSTPKSSSSLPSRPKSTPSRSSRSKSSGGSKKSRRR